MNILLESKCLQASFGQEMRNISGKKMKGTCILAENAGELHVAFLESDGMVKKTAKTAVEYTDVLADTAKIVGNAGAMAFRLFSASVSRSSIASATAMSRGNMDAIKEAWGDLKSDLSIHREYPMIPEQLSTLRFECTLSRASHVLYKTADSGSGGQNMICMKTCRAKGEKNRSVITSCMFYLESASQVASWCVQIRKHIPGIFICQLDQGTQV